MPSYFDRKVMESLSGPFNEWPLLLCPVCHSASLEPNMETIDSPVDYDVDYDADAIDIAEDWVLVPNSGFFHGALGCPRTPCRNKYVVAGSWELDYSMPGQVVGVKSYHVSYVFPAMPLMEFPEDVPDKVRDLVSAASLVLLSDASAAANRIRAAIEALLDYQGVHKFPSGSRSRRLTTHARIDEFRDRNSRAANHLMAMKWIGNIGSHEREPLALPVVLDGIEHFARALELIYDSRERALDRRAALINQRGRKFRPADVSRT